MRRFFAILSKAACFLMLGACFMLAGPAPEACAEPVKIKGTTTTLDTVVSLDYVYDDDFFSLPSDVYNHDFAKLSIGLSCSAFRDEAHTDAQDDYLIDFFQKMGFSNIETPEYRKAPEANSIAWGLATKKIGDKTIVACTVCGANYGKEWASNLTVGDMIRSLGFSDSANIVTAAIADYVARGNFDGEVVLWITGYSRGAAVANISAADCIASGTFNDVYAYTFATPMTTREPISYPNIFNVVQKEDLVTKIPFADWGFGRYGKDLFMMSPETDSECESITVTAPELYKAMVKSEMVTNSEINYQLRILADYLLLLFPDPASYTEGLQPLLVNIMGEEGADAKDALQILLKALNQYNADGAREKQELKEMLDYLETLVGYYYLQGGLEKLPDSMWDKKLGVATLFNAHFPFEYLAMVFSTDDPAKLFSENTDYIRLMIYGNVSASISDGTKVIKEVTADGKELVNGVEAPYSFPDVDCQNDKIVITLPADKSYEVTVTSNWMLPQTVSYTGALFSGRTIRAQADDYYTIIVAKGDQFKIKTSVNGRAIEAASSDYADISVFTEKLYSPTTSMRLENNDVVHLTLNGLINRLLLLILILIVQWIVSLILAAIRKKKGRKRNPKVALVWHGLIVFLFALLEIVLWYFVPILTLAKFIPAALAFIALCVYAFKGVREGYGTWKRFWIFVLAVAVYFIAESLFIGDCSIMKAVSLLVIWMVFVVVAYKLLWTKKKDKDEEPEEGQILMEGALA